MERIIKRANVEFVKPAESDTAPKKVVKVDFEFDKATPDYAIAFFGYMTCLLAKPLAKMAAKNKGYGNSVARRGVLGVLIRIEDKASRVWNILTKGGTLADASFGVQDESARDSVGDIKGYADINYAMSTNVSKDMTAWDEVNRIAQEADRNGLQDGYSFEY